ncbi:xanthine dehydrogenase family protein molybdopterin-binding subunit [bacterium]|nr:xanthine dehydrogenase family protein molybdopterin-binding subunit [bacterium]
MAVNWPKEPRVVGTRIKRLDGPFKTTGRAAYSYDITRPGMHFAVLLGSPHAHARVKTVDDSAAKAMPGVSAIHRMAKDGDELTYAGDPVLGIAADTEAHAYDALRAIKVEYEILPHSVTMQASEKEGAGKVSEKDDNVLKGKGRKAGDVDKALEASAAKIEGVYSLPEISHSCLESHGLLAEWNDGKLRVWCSTQATQNVAADLAKEFKISPANVKCITHHMGGGFGSKFNAGVEGLACAHLAKIAGRAVRLMLDRREEHSAGIRPSAHAIVAAGADASGKLIAFRSEQKGSPGLGSSANFPLPYVYENIPNVDTRMDSVRCNFHMTRAYRAPGHPQGCFVMESVMDDLAAKLQMDPVAFRRINLPEGQIGEIYNKELDIAMEMFGWAKKYHPPGKGPAKGSLRTGVGMACHKWGGGGVPIDQMLCEIYSDGTVLMQSSTQDLGTGNRTVLAIVAAEVFGLSPDQIKSEVGESEWARSHGSGGSTTCPSTAPASLVAATQARSAFFERLAKSLECKPEDLACEAGRVKINGTDKSLSWQEACQKLGDNKISELGKLNLGLLKALSDQGAGGCQFAEVQVDIETGEVRVIEVVAVQDCGLIINKLACESQVAGGVVMAVNAAVLEERFMDQATGRMLNPDMEFYKLGMIEDMPRIKVHMFDDPISTSRGVIGIGEPPTISTLAAIGNAIFNATGVRVSRAPFTPRHVLPALIKGGHA